MGGAFTPERKLEAIMKMKATLVTSALLLAVSAYLAIASAQAQKLSVRSRLIGTWMLVSTEQRLKDGTTRPYPDLGPDGKGYLLYTADGHMCAALMDPHRPRWKAEEKATDAEKISAMDGFTAYCGRYEVDEAARVVYHLPDIAWMPNWVGTKQKRPYSFRGELLTFSDKETGDPQVESWAIAWRKVK